MMKRLLLTFIVCILGTAVRAQALYPVPFEEKAAAASLIVEGRIQKGQPFWNPGHTMIFTSWTLEIYKVFKGQLPDDTVRVLTQGGFVGDQGIVASDLLQLQDGTTGVFFLFPNMADLKSPGAAMPLYDVYSSAQGFLKYDLQEKSAYAPFVRYEDIETDLYPKLFTLKDGGYQELKSRPLNISTTARKGTGTITTFTPQRVRAGAHNNPSNNVLTITGTGFGTASASAGIEFDNADDGTGGSYTFIPYNSPLVTSWTSSQIVVKVPASAGTGVFRIYDNIGALSATSSTLIVDYAIMAVDFGTGPQEVNMMNTNGAGGYNISYSTNTAGSGVNMLTSTALGTFQRALTTHQQTGGVNFRDSTGGVINTTTVQIINAGSLPNLVEYDNSNTGIGSPLPAGTLAVCYSGFSRCSGANIGVRLSGFDILLRNPGFSTGSTTFTSGPCPPAETSVNDLDLETVILHELGHAVIQGHINDDYQYVGGGYAAVNPASVMNYALLNGVKRSSYDNALLTGIQYAVTPKSQSYGACTGSPFSEMTPRSAIISSRDECSGLFPASTLVNGATISFDLVHATANKNTDPQYTALRTSNAGTNVTNTQYYAFRTGAAGGTVSMTINNYQTTPGAQAACTNSGVEIALYNVSACPTGQAYPVPAAHRIFSGNGALATIAALPANTNYLLVADGMENTKATFDMVIGVPTALPISLLNFQGQAIGTQHLLTWAFSPGELPQSSVLECSRNGQDFLPVYEENIVTNTEGRFINNPYPGTNYYRLQLKDKGGSITYSRTVVLTAADNKQLFLAPVPTLNNQTTLYYNAATAGKISMTLFHSSGQLSGSWVMDAHEGDNTFPLDMSAFTPGSYLLRVNTGAQTSPQYFKVIKSQ